VTAHALVGAGMPPGISLCVQLTWGKHQWESHAESAGACRRCNWWAPYTPLHPLTSPYIPLHPLACKVGRAAAAAGELSDGMVRPRRPLAPAPYLGPRTAPLVATIT